MDDPMRVSARCSNPVGHRRGCRARVRQTCAVQTRLRPTTPLGRAVLPVVGGLAFFAVLAAATWGIAALLSSNPDQVNERLARTTFEVGPTDRIAALIDEDGPLLFQGLVGTGAKGSVVLDHTGDVVDRGWVLYYAHPSDRDETCKVTQIEHTRRFTDCDGRELNVEDLAPPPHGVRPVVGDTVIIDLRAANTPTTTTDTTPTTVG
jgi:hypothetical protein